MTRPSLESAANIAILAVCLVVSASYAQQWFKSSPALPKALAQGDTFPEIKHIDLERADLTAVVVVRQDCPFCMDSMPFYKSLTSAASAKRAEGKVQVVFLTTDSTNAADEYLRVNGVLADRVLSITRDDLQTLKVQGTPTLLLVARDRVIREVWLGKLNSENERVAFAALGLI